jgi:hypothetical protein
MTISLARQGLNVLDDQIDDFRDPTPDCVTLPCPCGDPCRWMEQALDALRQDGWPDPPLRLLGTVDIWGIPLRALP